MRVLYLAMIIITVISLSACSGGVHDPVSSPLDQTLNQESPQEAVIPATASDYYLTGNSRNVTAYKAFGIYQVIIDPVNLTGEIIPARNASKIGDTFDADLTQFLTVTPCANCLQINGINFLGNDQVQVGFAIKHPFSDITKRPDLHVFDVRGIIITKGNYNFPHIGVQIDETTSDPARANVSLLANADGYTHHFDELALDPNYFDPPRNYDANINPYKRYFVDTTDTVFDAHSPSGHNVMATGADWDTQDFVFNIPAGGTAIDFAFVADCSYGVSATFANRQNPYYFLPEFNRKEAWSVEVLNSVNDLQSGNTTSTAIFIVRVIDWQASMVADPDYPDISSLWGISADSDIKSIEMQIPAVTDGMIHTENIISGSGTPSDPANFQLTATNTLGAPAGNYYGLVAVRDDLQGLQGPIGIPESPTGFPYEGPEIWDYSTYSVISIRVKGTPPDVLSIADPGMVMENTTVNLSAIVDEADGDDVTYYWWQVSPASPKGIFINQYVKDAQFIAPDLYDVPSGGVLFTLRLVASDLDGETYREVSFYIMENNNPPECDELLSDPYFGVFTVPDSLDLSISAHDPDGDLLTYEWDFNWNGIPDDFFAGMIGPSSADDIFWTEQGFHNVGCRITESRTNPLKTICSRTFIQEGYLNNTMKVDDSLEADPNLFQPDTLLLGEVDNHPIAHAIYIDIDDDTVYYCNNANDNLSFGNHLAISTPPSSGNVNYCKIAGYGDTVHVIWNEDDFSVVPNVSRLKINTSTDLGETWGAMGGERTIASSDDPYSHHYTAITATDDPNVYGLVFGRYNGAGPNYMAYFMISLDGGLSWGFPSGGTGMFRDVMDSTYNIDFELAHSSDNDVFHVFWRDNRAGGPHCFYDYSTDQGDTWHTDMQVTTTTNQAFSSMAVADNGDAYFVWEDNTTMMCYFRRTTYGTPPILSSVNIFFNLGVPNFRGVDIWVSPDADILLVPLTYQSSGGNYQHRYFYSYNKGGTLNTYFTRSFGTTEVYDMSCDAVWFTEPNRVQQFTGWIDYNTGISPNAHIYGDFLYLADRF